jgi:hypothetical protein
MGHPKKIAKPYLTGKPSLDFGVASRLIVAAVETKRKQKW